MTETKATQVLPGLELDRLRGWFRTVLPDARIDELRAEMITGGRSNLTYRLGDGDRDWILRRPPLGHVLATAHDMAREHRVMDALAGSGVPVPRTVGLCEDVDVIGAPFYMMEAVPGTPYRTLADLEAVGPDRTRVISTALIDTLVGLHRVDPEQVGLEDFGRPAGFLTRQVRRWRQQLASSSSRELPDAEILHARLEAAAPHVDATSQAGIVHGDYRLDNVLFGDDDRVAAVLDWEMATLGDPITDLALLVTYARLAETLEGVVPDASSAPGHLNETEMLAQYALSGGRDLSRFGFYLGLAAFKLAVILEGIHYRHLHGQTVGPGFDLVGDAIPSVLAAGLAVIDQ